LEKERLQAQEESKKIADAKQQAEEAALKAKEQQKQAEAAAAQARAQAEKELQAAALAKQKAEAEAKKQAEQAKKAEEAKQKAEADAKKKAEQEAKKKAEEEARKKAEAEEKKKAEQEAKQKAAADAKKKAAAEAAAKQNQEVEDLLGGLASSKNAPTASGASGGGQKSGASGPLSNDYNGRLASAITSKLFNCPVYIGRTCELRIRLTPEGKLLDAKAEGGDPALCQAAVVAAKEANIPAPPKAIAKDYENTVLAFKLESCIK
ncbi:MAG: cell envelope integrity protein TolA, partial [Enterobacteriaceae bacterium]